MSDEDDVSVWDIECLLSTILVPSFPPNRSQWKKLEIALKFIKKSKQSAVSNSHAFKTRTELKRTSFQHGRKSENSSEWLMLQLPYESSILPSVYERYFLTITTDKLSGRPFN